MTQHPSRPPPYLQPRPKAVPTLSDASGISKVVTSPHVSRPSSLSRQPSPARPRPIASDASERATRALIRRVLCSDTHTGSKEPRPLDELLPPLTSSNDIDLQLYATIAIVVKELVHSWYGKITPDRSFVEEVIQIVAHCTRAIESRLRSVDLESLIFDELPELIESHVHAYRTARPSTPTTPFRRDPRTIYHHLTPHPALSPVPEASRPSTVTEQSEHEAQYRQLLVQSALAILLPTEDLENACLRTLVADVVADIMLGNAIGGKLSEGYFIWGSISKLVEVVKARTKPKTTGEEVEVDTRSRLEKFGLLSERGEATRPRDSSQRSVYSTMFWRLLQYAFLTVLTVRFVIQGFIASSSRPGRSASMLNAAAPSPIAKSFQTRRPPRPLLRFKTFSLVASVLDLRLRAPWLSGSLSLLQYHLVSGPFGLGDTDGILDQYIHHLIQTYLVTATHIPPLLATLRTTLFPNFALPPPGPPPPSAAQVAAVKRSCAVDLLSLIPPFALPRLFPGMSEEERIAEVEGELDIWSDGYLNKHLAYRVVELVFVRILPEMGESGCRELYEGRGVV